jgi:hypothetical protein
MRLEQHLAERIGAAGEEEDVRARIRARERVALLPAEERRVLAEALAQRAGARGGRALAARAPAARRLGRGVVGRAGGRRPG